MPVFGISSVGKVVLSIGTTPTADKDLYY